MTITDTHKLMSKVKKIVKKSTGNGNRQRGKVIGNGTSIAEREFERCYWCGRSNAGGQYVSVPANNNFDRFLRKRLCKTCVSIWKQYESNFLELSTQTNKRYIVQEASIEWFGNKSAGWGRCTICNKRVTKATVIHKCIK